MKTKFMAALLALVMVMSLVPMSVFAAEEAAEYNVGTGQTYETLEAAIAAAKNDGNTAIVYNIYGKVEPTTTGWFNPVPTTANIVSFVGKTDDAEICFSSSDAQIFGIDNRSTKVDITFTDLTLNRLNGSWWGDYGHANIYFTTWVRGNSETTVTYTRCTFPNGASTNQYGTTNYYHCRFEGSENCLWISSAYDEASANVEGCSFNANNGLWVHTENGEAESNVTIKSCSFDVIKDTPAIVSAMPGTVTITDTIFEQCPYGYIGNETSDRLREPATITIDGKTPSYVAKVEYTLNGNPGVNYYQTVEYAEEACKKIEEKSIYGYGNIKLSTATVAIGETKYFTLEEAVAAAKDKDTVKVLTDVELSSTLTIPAGKEITLDLNGKDITYTSTTQNESMIKNQGTLIINDSSEAQDGSIICTYAGEPDPSYGKGNYTISNAGHLTVNAGTIALESENISHMRDAIDNNSSGADAILVINGGTIVCDTYMAIRQFANSATSENSVTINGGTIIGGKRAVYIQLPSSNPVRTPKAELIINDGTLTSYDDESYDLAVYVYSYGDTSANTKVIINGGTFNGNVQFNGKASTSLSKENVSISGGSFNHVYAWGEVPFGFVTGGTFVEDPSDYVAEGYYSYKTGDNKYVVKVMPTETPDEGEDEGEHSVLTNEVTTDAAISEDVVIPESSTVTEQDIANTAGSVSSSTLPELEAMPETYPENTTSLQGFVNTTASDIVESTLNTNDKTIEDIAEDVEATDVSNVAVVVVPSLEVEVTSYTEETTTLEDGTEETTKTLEFDIEPKYDVVAINKDTGKTSTIEKDQELEVTEPVVITMELPADFAEPGDILYIEHEKEDHSIYIYEGKVSEDENGNLILTFVNPNGFSIFRITTRNTAVASVDGVGYNDIYAALAVANGKTITLLQDIDEDIVITAPITFTLDKNGRTVGSVTALNGLVLTKNGDTYTVIKNYSFFPHLQYVNLKATEGGTISGNKNNVITKFMAALGSRRTIYITPDEGYEIVDVIVNGKSIGAVETFRLVATQPNNVVKAIFAEIND